MIAAQPAVLLEALRRTIVGQEEAIESLAIALLCGGHALLEGPPGVAKTLACRSLAAALEGEFKRVQFTPDLLPADITGTRIFDQRESAFATVLGPIFANVVLADEINRAPAKVQSALLEAMQERQVTIGPQSYALPDPFIVLATMNPADSDGTYPLPLAQLDRFLLSARVSYPSHAEELAILERFGVQHAEPETGVAGLEDARFWRERANAVHLDAQIKRYIVDIVALTRADHPYLASGASPRATLALAAAARAKALLGGRDFALPDDVRSIAPRVLRHRLAFTHRAALDNVAGDAIVQSLVESVKAP